MRDSKFIKEFRSKTNTGRTAIVWFDEHDGVYNVQQKTAVGEREPEQFNPADHDDDLTAARREAITHAEAWVDQPATNTERVVHIMEWARSGPLMQAFVMQALAQYAERVANAPAEKLDTAMVSGAAWKACAIELRDYLKKD